MVQNDVFEFFFVASAAVSMGVLFLGIVPYKLCKYVMAFVRNKRGAKHVG